MIRCNNYNLFFRCKALLRQIMVDVHVQTKSERLRFISLKQNNMGAEKYILLQEAITNDAILNLNAFG